MPAVVQPRSSPAQRYAGAILLVMAAALVSAWLAPFLAKTAFIFFWPAVLASAWYGGRGPAALAVALATLAVDVLFISTGGTGVPERTSDALALLFFLVLAGIISEMTSRYRVTQRRAVMAEGDAQERAEELQAQAEELELTAEEAIRTNSAISEAERLLRETQAIARIGSWEWDAERDTLTWSDTLCELYGLAPGHAPKTFAEYDGLLHPADRADSRAIVGRARETGEAFAFEHRVLWPDGSVHTLRAHGRVDLDASGAVQRMVGSSQDITASHAAEQALRESEARFRRLFVESPLPMWIFDVESFRFLDANHAALRQYGYSLEELLAMRVSEIRPPEAVPEFEQMVRRSVKAGTEVRGLFRHRRKDGTEMDVEVTTQAADFNGRNARLVLAADVTEREQLLRAEREARTVAEQANKAKTDFLATMSHELRTPLNAIGGYAELLELGIHGPLSDKQVDAVQRIRRSQRHLLGLINDVLNFAKLSAGRVDYNLREVRVQDVLDALEPLVSVTMEKRSQRYEQVGCEDGLRVLADEEKLQQVLLNLLSNAIKFTPPGGRIRVECEARGDQVRISVRDSGPGVPEDRQEQIFEPFVQVNRALNAPHEGTGLGLSISRDLAVAMRGMLTVENQAGGGARFTLSLPRIP